MTTGELVTAFRANFYGVWFTETPDSLLSPAIEEVVSRSMSGVIKNNCARKYERYVILQTVMLLNSSGLTMGLDCDGEAVVVVDDIKGRTKLQVSKDEVADTSRTFFKNISTTNDDSVIEHIKLEVSEIEESCKKSLSVYGIGGGSNYTTSSKPTTGCH